MKKTICFLAIATVILSSCIKKEDISLKGVENISINSMSNIEMILGVENRAGKDINIESAKFRIENKGETMVSMLLKDRVVIPKRATSSVRMNWALKFDNPLGAFAAIGALKRSPQNLTVSGDIVVRAGWTKKKIELKAVPLSQILATFGMKADDIMKSIEL